MQPSQSDQPAAGQDETFELTIEQSRTYVSEHKAKYEKYSQSGRAAALADQYANDVDVFAKERADMDRFRAALEKVHQAGDSQDSQRDRLLEQLEHVEDDLLKPAEEEAKKRLQTSLVVGSPT